MRQKPILILLSVLIATGLAAALFLMKAPLETGGTPEPAPSATVAAPGPNPEATASAAPATATGAPDLTADATGLSRATVTVTTSKGAIRYRFYPADAPKTVYRMIELIRGKFYDGLTFHRVVPGFVVQGGDPAGNGTGGSGQRLKAEFNSRKHVEGTLAMARAADPDSADSQFYIALGPQPHLDGAYTVFGQVVEGMDVVRRLVPGDQITSITVE